jgi:hypothetical protein
MEQADEEKGEALQAKWQTKQPSAFHSWSSRGKRERVAQVSLLIRAYRPDGLLGLCTG